MAFKNQSYVKLTGLSSLNLPSGSKTSLSKCFQSLLIGRAEHEGCSLALIFVFAVKSLPEEHAAQHITAVFVRQEHITVLLCPLFVIHLEIGPIYGFIQSV